MKKVIPYIASNFKKDKIWMRRTKPSKRQYQVVFAIDNSESMIDNNSGELACEALCLITKALSLLEVGEISVVSFGEKTELLHPLDKPFSDNIGGSILSQLAFKDKQTDVSGMVSFVVQMLSHSRNQSINFSENLQIVFVISDGRFSNREEIRKFIIEAYSQQQLFVFLIIDHPKNSNSILQLQTISYPNGKLTCSPYLDNFPFPYYIILREIKSIPEILADALRQWMEMISSSFL
ncbi:midasin [Anaeramoeba ignava]|nr:midasin [Anaeramoeba ignava]